MAIGLLLNLLLLAQIKLPAFSLRCDNIETYQNLLRFHGISALCSIGYHTITLLRRSTSQLFLADRTCTVYILLYTCDRLLALQ